MLPLNKVFDHIPKVKTIPMAYLRIVLLYLGNMLHIMETQMKKFVDKNLEFCHILSCFQNKNQA